MKVKIDETYHVVSCYCPLYVREVSGKIVPFMLIGSRQRLNTLTASPTIRMNNTQVSKVRATKSLGVIIDDNLDWHSHIEKLTKKIASGIGALKRIRHLGPVSRKPRKVFGPVKPFLNHLYLKTEKCKRLKLLV